MPTTNMYVQRGVKGILEILTNGSNPADYSNYWVEGETQLGTPIAIAGIFPDSPFDSFYAMTVLSDEQPEVTPEEVRQYRSRILNIQPTDKILQPQKEQLEKWNTNPEQHYLAVGALAYFAAMPIVAVVFLEEVSDGAKTAGIFHSSLMPTQIAIEKMQGEIRKVQIQEN